MYLSIVLHVYSYSQHCLQLLRYNLWNRHLHSTYSGPGTILGTSGILTNLVLTTAVWKKDCDHHPVYLEGTQYGDGQRWAGNSDTGSLVLETVALTPAWLGPTLLYFDQAFIGPLLCFLCCIFWSASSTLILYFPNPIDWLLSLIFPLFEVMLDKWKL